MDERQAVLALIERLASEAGIRDPHERGEFEREILSHFEETGESYEALERFGAVETVRRAVRRAYHRHYAGLRIAKILASVFVSIVFALALEECVGLHMESVRGPGRLSPVFTHVSVGIVLALAAGWELGIEPFCERLERRPLRLLAAFGVLVGGIDAIHLADSIAVDSGRVMVVSALLLAVWISTAAVLARFDRMFLGILDWN